MGIEVPYDGLNFDHRETLRAFCDASYPGEELHECAPFSFHKGWWFHIIGELIFLWKDLLQKQEGDRAMWKYPFALADVNITFTPTQMLDLEAGRETELSIVLEMIEVHKLYTASGTELEIPCKEAN
ncbi:uncharacterized protein LOC113332788 [Papaver somniferum]|uniref:uncharacterized protein LOC113332788 n=1 Tax=Papaver somniferum TaxID=3469 RepID=UPI000E6FA908|nr:uncharacterized protein LOC113332788 [Papaver somniferum]